MDLVRQSGIFLVVILMLSRVVGQILHLFRRLHGIKVILLRFLLAISRLSPILFMQLPTLQILVTLPLWKGLIRSPQERVISSSWLLAQVQDAS